MPYKDGFGPFAPRGLPDAHVLNPFPGTPIRHERVIRPAQRALELLDKQVSAPTNTWAWRG